MRKNKNGASRVMIDDIAFASKSEGRRYLELKQKEKNGEIQFLECHPRFELQPSFKDSDGKHWRAIHYTADFQYWRDKKIIVEEVKNPHNAKNDAAYSIRRRLFVKKFSELKFMEFIR